jgi:hypothetical protein
VSDSAGPLHGYCIRRAADEVPPRGLTGVKGAPVRRLQTSALSVWVSAAGGEPPTVDRLREHEVVVRAALTTATPLPLRYGSVFRAEQDALDLLDGRRVEFEELLARFDRCVEMGLRISRVDPQAASGAGASSSAPGPPPGARAGREYLETRKRAFAAEQQTREQAERILDELEANLADLRIPSARTVLPGEGLTGTLAHLVHRDNLRQYQQRIDELVESRPDLRINVSGPWAPYSFV